MVQRQPTHATCLLFVGAERQPSFVVERCRLPSELGPDEALVRVRIAGICGSDLRRIVGSAKDHEVPVIPGHEAVGDVLASKRADVAVGDRVVFSVCSWCTRCEWCLRGIFLACSSVMKYGHHPVADGIGLNGTLSSHVVLRKGTAVATVPRGVPDGPALLAACPLPVAIAGVLRAAAACRHKEDEGTALVQGCGLLGILTCAVLVENGFKVFCMDPNVYRLQLASKFNAEPVFKESGPMTRSANLPSRLDLVVCAFGSRGALADGPGKRPGPSNTPSSCFLESHASQLRAGGTLLLMGDLPPSASLNVTAIATRGLCIIGASEYEPNSLADAINFLEQTEGKYPYNELLSPIYGLPDFQNALSSALEKKFFRVIVRPMVV